MSRVAHVAALLALLTGCAKSDVISDDAAPAGTETNLEDGEGGDGSGGEVPTSSGSDAGGGDGDGDGDGDGGDDTASGGGGDGGGTAGAGGGDTGGAGGGAPPGCGDGVVAANEECDDANATAGDGCTTCVIDCEPGGAKDPLSGNCYRVFEDPTTWPFAEANCQAWGGAPGLGHLASIADAAEQDLVFSLIAQQAWIGVQDPVTEDVYQWSDGTPWAYEHWAPGEPDNTHEEDCAFMRTTDDGGWNDHACGDDRPAYVCERRGAGTF